MNEWIDAGLLTSLVSGTRQGIAENQLSWPRNFNNFPDAVFGSPDRKHDFPQPNGRIKPEGSRCRKAAQWFSHKGTYKHDVNLIVHCCGPAARHTPTSADSRNAAGRLWKTSNAHTFALCGTKMAVGSIDLGLREVTMICEVGAGDGAVVSGWQQLRVIILSSFTSYASAGQ